MPKFSSHAYKLQLKIKNAANTCSNDVVVTQNNTHHISNSQKTAKVMTALAKLSALNIIFLAEMS